MVPATAAVWTHVSRCPHYANKHQNNIYILFHVCTQITFHFHTFLLDISCSKKENWTGKLKNNKMIKCVTYFFKI